jgi:lysozyme
MSAGTRIQGIDVSHFQGTVNWQEVKQAGMKFAIAKATEGQNTVDSQFKTNWQNIKAAGLLRGAYHFFDAGIDGTSQANHFLQTAQVEAGDLPPVIDVEAAANASNATILQEVQNWLDTVEQALNRLPMIYTTASFWNSHLNHTFGKYPLWVAEYGVSVPKIPAGWSNWQFWQYSQSGSVEGVTGSVDMDYFNGSYDDLLAFLQLAEPQSSSTEANAAGSGTSNNAPATSETTEETAAASTTAVPASATTAITYTVKAGDTLDRIAAHYGVSETELAEANHISDPNKIYVGQVLTIP